MYTGKFEYFACPSSIQVDWCNFLYQTWGPPRHAKRMKRRGEVRDMKLQGAGAVSPVVQIVKHG